MTPSLGGGKEGQVFTEQDFIVEAPQTHVTYRPLTGTEIEPITVGNFWDHYAFGATVTVLESAPVLAESISFDEPLRLENHALDRQGLTDEDKDRIAEFWIVYAGHELHVWCLRLNELSNRRATYEAQQEPHGHTLHSDPVHGWLSTLELELSALKRIEFYFGKFVHAAGEIHREDFLNELTALVDRQEWKQHLRDVCSKSEKLLSIH